MMFFEDPKNPYVLCRKRIKRITDRRNDPSVWRHCCYKCSDVQSCHLLRKQLVPSYKQKYTKWLNDNDTSEVEA